jgi:hypothetical protein
MSQALGARESLRGMRLIGGVEPVQRDSVSARSSATTLSLFTDSRLLRLFQQLAAKERRRIEMGLLVGKLFGTGRGKFERAN